jgi:hypothetical protein
MSDPRDKGMNKYKPVERGFIKTRPTEEPSVETKINDILMSYQAFTWNEVGVAYPVKNQKFLSRKESVSAITDILSTQQAQMRDKILAIPTHWERAVDGHKGTPLPDCPRNIDGYRQDILNILGEEMINSADITGIYLASTMEEVVHRRNGEHKCKHNNWHARGEQCDCGSRLSKDTFIPPKQESSSQEALDKVRETLTSKGVIR